MEFSVLLQRVRETIERFAMLRRGCRVGVAVSGGADSVCLLRVLLELAPAYDVRLVVLHLNHCLRGQESDGDAEFVAALAAELGLTCEVERWRVGTERGNLEQDARRARAEFFAASRERLDLDRIATGHTLTDQAETVVFRMARGSGPGGLAGILPVTREGLIRPLLEVERAGVLAWLRERGAVWREDSSNATGAFTRNRVRHSIVPLLDQEVHSGAARALARLAALAREDEEYWAEVVEREFQALNPAEPWVVEVERLRGMRPALGRRLLLRALEHASGSRRRFTCEHVERIWALALGRAGEGRLSAPGVEAWRSLGWLRLAAPDREVGRDWCASLAEPGELRAGPVRIAVVDGAPAAGEEARRPGTLYNVDRDLLDRDRVSFPLEVRNLRPGASYQPVGRERAWNLLQMLVSERIPSWDRWNWPMIVSGGRIVWSRRFGAAAGVAASVETRRWLRIEEG